MDPNSQPTSGVAPTPNEPTGEPTTEPVATPAQPTTSVAPAVEQPEPAPTISPATVVPPAPAPTIQPTPNPGVPLASMPPTANMTPPLEPPQKGSIIKKILMAIGVIAVIAVIGVGVLYFVGKSAIDAGVKKADDFVALLEKGESSELDEALYDNNWSIKYICKKGDLGSDNFLCQDLDNTNDVVKKATIAGSKGALSEVLTTLKTSDAKRYSDKTGKNKYGDIVTYAYYKASGSGEDLYLKVTVVRDSSDNSLHVLNTEPSKTKPTED